MYRLNPVVTAWRKREQQHEVWVRLCRKASLPFNRLGGNESESHLVLKAKAAKWLESKGLYWVIEGTIYSPDSQHHDRADVVGLSSKGLVIPIECGSVLKSKAERVASDYPVSYHWPYGAEKPHLMRSCIGQCRPDTSQLLKRKEEKELAWKMEAEELEREYTKTAKITVPLH